MDYIYWNNIVADYLFKSSRRGQEVFLYLTEDDLVQAVQVGSEKPSKYRALAGRLAERDRQDILADFWSALQKGPLYWEYQNKGRQATIGGLVRRNAPLHPADCARYTWQDWNMAELGETTGTRLVKYDGHSVGLTAPLHLLYLACFTMAFSMADAAGVRNGYYDCWDGFFKANDLLFNGRGFPSNALAVIGNDWVKMWEELARWSGKDLNGERGVLVARKLGGYAHVGWPKAQCLLPPSVLSRLPVFFGRFQLLPGAMIIPDKMRELLLTANNGLELPAVTLAELRNGGELCQALTDMVQRVLSRWDGSTNRRERTSSTGGQVRMVEHWGETYASLLPFLPTDLAEGEAVTWHYRLRIKAPLPETLTICIGSEKVWIQPETSEWSSEIVGITPSTTAHVYVDKINGWKMTAQLPGLQVFVPGNRYGFFHHWAPVPTLERGTELLLLCQDEYAATVKSWGQTAGTAKFLDWSHFDGLLPKYCLFWFESLPEGVTGLPGIPVASEAQILVQGGLNCGNRQYLAEAPPAFRLLNGEAGQRLGLVYMENEETLLLRPDGTDKSLWQLPLQVRKNERFRIVAEAMPDVNSLPLSLHEVVLPTNYQVPLRGKRGEVVTEQVEAICYNGTCFIGTTTELHALHMQQQVEVPKFTPGF